MPYAPSRKTYKPKLDRQGVEQICAELDCYPIAELVQMAMATAAVRDSSGRPVKDERTGKTEYKYVLEPRLRVEVLKALAEHIYPKLRTQEVKEQLDVKFTVTINRFEEPKKQIEHRPPIEIPTVELPNGN